MNEECKMITEKPGDGHGCHEDGCQRITKDLDKLIPTSEDPAAAAASSSSGTVKRRSAFAADDRILFSQDCIFVMWLVVNGNVKLVSSFQKRQPNMNIVDVEQ